jgi:hypothetical protein
MSHVKYMWRLDISEGRRSWPLNHSRKYFHAAI